MLPQHAPRVQPLDASWSTVRSGYAGGNREWRGKIVPHSSPWNSDLATMETVGPAGMNLARTLHRT